MPKCEERPTCLADPKPRKIYARTSLASLIGALAFLALAGCTPVESTGFAGDTDSGAPSANGSSSGSGASSSTHVDSGAPSSPGTGAKVGQTGNSGQGSTPEAGSSSSNGGIGNGSGGDASSISAEAGGANTGPNTTITNVVPDSSRYAYSVTLKMDTFTVNAGQEIYMCQDFANPFMGVQADIVSYELHMSNGSHHMFAFYTANATDASIITCPSGGLTFAPYTFTAGSPDAVETYPDGMGAGIPGTQGFTLNAHFINAGASSLQGNVALTMYVAKPGQVKQQVGPIFLNQALLSVPATNQPSTSTSSYSLPQDVNLLLGASHMHQRATNFIATTSTGQTLYQTTVWAEPKPVIYSPPLLLKSGTTITWSCTYVNDTGATLTFGESASTNVMCISEFIYYPVADPTNPVIGSQL
jgi:hypothetical protein